MANEIDKIADEFIDQLNGGEEQPVTQAQKRRSTYSKGMFRRTTTMLKNKLSKIDESRETPHGENENVDSA